MDQLPPTSAVIDLEKVLNSQAVEEQNEYLPINEMVSPEEQLVVLLLVGNHSQSIKLLRMQLEVIKEASLLTKLPTIPFRN